MKKLIMLLLLIVILGCSNSKNATRKADFEYRSRMRQVIYIYQTTYGLSYQDSTLIIQELHQDQN